uniref:Interferon alpha-2-like n=1 Tax=Pogona vitticeps TaxID=103695 RepID=A0ABM5FCT5_9SAUR
MKVGRFLESRQNIFREIPGALQETRQLHNLITMAVTTRDCGLQVCLVLLLFSIFTHSSQFSFSKCPPIHAQWDQLIKTKLNHLCRTSEQFHQECLFEIKDFMFPQDVLKVKRSNRLIVVYKILQQISYFLNKDNPQDIWNSTCIENLQNSLHQQIKELETCLGATETQRGLVNFGNTASYSLTLKIKRYFQRLNNFITDNQHSHCAWEIIYLEIKGCFLFVTQLLKLLKL